MSTAFKISNNAILLFVVSNNRPLSSFLGFHLMYFTIRPTVTGFYTVSWIHLSAKFSFLYIHGLTYYNWVSERIGKRQDMATGMIHPEVYFFLLRQIISFQIESCYAFTIIFPVLSPLNNPTKASGKFSKPCLIVSVDFNFPSFTHADNCLIPSGNSD